MFDFIFKRSRKKPATQLSATNQEPTAPTPQVSAAQTALTQAESLSGDESVAVDFILQCQFADARLKVAEHVRSRPMLERVLQRMRNTDRRVAKLMQMRLDTLKRQEICEQEAQRCVNHAQRLAHDSQLTPNQVADLDRAWGAIEIPQESLRQQFEHARAILRERLQAQADLQRAAMDIIAKMRNAVDRAGLVSDETTKEISDLEQEMSRLNAAPEAASLPRHLLTEFERQLGNFKQKQAISDQQSAAINARNETLERWEASELASLKADALQRKWQSLAVPIHDDAAALLDARFDTLIRRIAESRKSKPPVEREETHDAKQRFVEALDSLEKALQEGALQAAVEHDKILRSIDTKAAKPSDAQTAQLTKVRAELHRLQSWARWGGNVSREELLKAAEDLPKNSLPALELAKKVGSLRERWKSLDVSAGPSTQELWTRFDAACTVAYEPAAAHFKRLAEERQLNLAKAQALIDEVRQFAATSNCATADPATIEWKEVANFCNRMSQAWRRLGTIERKERKSLDSEFRLAMQVLTDPLTQQRTREIERREKLIEEANNLVADERGTLDALRALQERWQEQAKSLPLERKDEEALWQRFRSACDTLFAKRKEVVAAAGADRRQHLHQKEAVCVALEAAADMPEAGVLKAMREAKEAWSTVGPVPRASENQIEARYKSAMTALQKRLDAVKRAALEEEGNTLRNKLRLCQAVETAVVTHQPLDTELQDKWRMAWQALPVMSSTFERPMRDRFDRALNALSCGDQQYASELNNNAEALVEELLRSEILLGVDSPAELSRRRLQLQVEVLQSSLKAGQKPVTQETQVLKVCALPAVANTLDANRIEWLIEKFTRANA